jgi:polyisoprenoid-binding protein YceI
MTALSLVKPIAAAALLFGGLQALAPLPAPMSFAAGSRVTILGTSNVRSFRCESTRVQGTIQNAGAVPTVAEVAHAIRGAEVSLPVASLDCANGTMNNHMRHAMKAEQFPTVSFTLPASGLTAGDGSVRMAGTLNIAGAEKPASVTATVAQAEGGLRVTGSYAMKMSDFGIRPPTVMLGAFRVNDDVTVQFDVTVR